MKSLWRMSRRRPARRITQKNNSIGGVCRLTYCNPKQIGGILIAKLIVAEKPSVAMSYAKVLGATRRQDGYLKGNGYLVSWCVGHLVELAPPNMLIYPRELYQRGVQRKRVEMIAADFNEYVANEPKVSFRNGKYYVVDGQHTIEGRMAYNGKGRKDALSMKF